MADEPRSDRGSGPVVFDHRADGVVVRLDRPAVRNAVNLELATALTQVMGSLDGAQCVVLTGTDPAFCAGLDLRDLGVERLTDLPRFLDAVAQSPVPVIAAVNGPP